MDCINIALLYLYFVLLTTQITSKHKSAFSYSHRGGTNKPNRLRYSYANGSMRHR